MNGGGFFVYRSSITKRNIPDSTVPGACHYTPDRSCHHRTSLVRDTGMVVLCFKVTQEPARDLFKACAQHAAQGAAPYPGPLPPERRPEDGHQKC